MIILPRHSLKALLLVVGLWAILMLRHLEALVHTFFVPTTTRYYSQHTPTDLVHVYILVLISFSVVHSCCCYCSLSWHYRMT